MSSALICLLIQMSYGNVETILGANLAGREIVKTCLLVPVFKASLPISQSCPPPTSQAHPGSILIGGWLGTSPLCLPHVNRHKRSDYLYPQLLHTQMIIKNNEAKHPKWFSMGESYLLWPAFPRLLCKICFSMGTNDDFVLHRILAMREDLKMSPEGQKQDGV